MSNENRHEEKIIEALKNMPEITDDTPKNILYQRVTSNITNERTNKKGISKYLPVFGSVLALVLIIFIPLSLNNPSDKVVEENSMSQLDANMAENHTMTSEEYSQPESELTKKDSILSDDAAGSSEEAEQEIMMNQDELDHYVVHTVDDESNLIYGAIPDEQFQYVIPIAFIVSKSLNTNEHYNKLQQYISEAGILEVDYLLEDITFTIDNEVNEVIIKLPETYSIESSAQAYMFVKMLETMFIPLGIEKAVFVSKSGEGVDFGPIGTVKELTLQEEGNANYKLYKNQFLVPIPLDEQVTIDEAILDMKNNLDHITQTIPEYINFTFDSLESELILTYTGEKALSDNQQMVTMIEAILMTAKHYGFETVKFTNMNIPSIGNYNLTQPVDVPDAVNPIVRD